MRCSQRSISSDRSYDNRYDDEGWEMPWSEREPKVLALCREIWPTAEHKKTTAEYLGQGGSNTAVGVSIFLDGKEQKFVVRIPYLHAHVMKSVGILMYLCGKTDFEVPQVLGYSQSGENALGSPYILMTRIPGQHLGRVLEDLTHDQKLVLAEDLAQVIKQIQSIKIPVAGSLQVHTTGLDLDSNIEDHIYVQAFGSERFTPEWFSKKGNNTEARLIPVERLMKDPPNLDMIDVFAGPFERKYFQAFNPEDGYPWSLLDEEIVVPLLKIASGMIGMNLFEGNEICLCHTDLFPRNIMVDFTQRPVITGIIDWDDCAFAPTFMSCVAPRWLWRSEEAYNTDREPETFAFDELDPDTVLNAEVKEKFKANFDQDWIDMAEDPPYILARRIFHCATKKDWVGGEYDDAAKWLQEWEEITEHMEPVETEGTSTAGPPQDTPSEISHDGTDDSLDLGRSPSVDTTLTEPSEQGDVHNQLPAAVIAKANTLIGKFRSIFPKPTNVLRKRKVCSGNCTKASKSSSSSPNHSATGAEEQRQPERRRLYTSPTPTAHPPRTQNRMKSWVSRKVEYFCKGMSMTSGPVSPVTVTGYHHTWTDASYPMMPQAMSRGMWA